MDKALRAVLVGVGLLAGVWVVARLPKYLVHMERCGDCNAIRNTAHGLYPTCEGYGAAWRKVFEGKWSPTGTARCRAGAVWIGNGDQLLAHWDSGSHPSRSKEDCNKEMNDDSAALLQYDVTCRNAESACRACKAGAWRAFLPE